jgi:uncharacterized protein YndB with AHSA1/START domain
MPDITHDFPINAPPAQVFRALSDPKLLDEWWTQRSAGKPALGEAYDLDFGPGYAWRAQVTKCVLNVEFELTMTAADADWMGTRVGMQLKPIDGGTQVRFAHSGWPNGNEHFRISSFCWAMYLRVLKRHLEFGERVPYEKRLDV